MNEDEKRIVRWVAGVSAAVTAVAGVIVGAPGDLIPQGYVIGLLATSAGLSGFVAFMTGAGGEA